MMPWLFTIIYIVASLVLLYWQYPFDGMVINESWGLHFNQVREFKFFGYGDTRHIVEPMSFLYEPSTQTFNWSFLYSRRGLVPVIYLLLDWLAVGDRIVFTNAVCVGVLGLNLLLFAYVVWKLAGPGRLFPMVIAFGLYPFSAGIHYWQVIVVNNLAMTLFLLSLSFFLRMDYEQGRLVRNIGFCALPSLICYWLSLFNHEYAIFWAPLYLYLALYYSHGRTTLWRFTNIFSPYAIIGWIFVLAGLVCAWLLASQVPSVLLYAARFRELAVALHLPEWLLPVVTTLANAGLFYLSLFFSNSVGLLLYPVQAVYRDLAPLQLSPLTFFGIGLLAFAIVWGLALSERLDRADRSQDNACSEGKFLLVFGMAWALMAYIPFSTSIGYPRVVGLMADRVNILASGGIAIVGGVFWGACAHRFRKIGWAGAIGLHVMAFAVVCILLLNLYIQREYFVEAFRKERDVARAVLAIAEESRREGWTPVILLDRSTKVVFPRAELLTALQAPGVGTQIQKVGVFLFDRYFTQEVLSTSFNLNGIFLFGCCPDSAYQTFNGYAKLWGRDKVEVYKYEEPFRIYEDEEVWRLGYQDTRAWAPVYEAERLVTYAKQGHRILVFKIGESFFTFRGGGGYQVHPHWDGSSRGT